MLDIGWSELLLIGIVALIVVGPEDLPRMFHALGKITARARAVAREFSRAMEDAAKTSGLDEASKTLRDVKGMTSRKSLGLDALDRAADSFEKWEPGRSAAKKGLQPDPGQADVKDADATPRPDPAAGQPAPDGAADLTTPVAAEQPGKRQLRAVRRSDRDGI